MGLMNNIMKQATKAGHVSGSKFPRGTYINFRTENNEQVLLFTYPGGKEEVISHDMVKCATVLAMGVIEIKQVNNTTTSIYGTKYLCVLKDDRQAVLTVGLGDSQEFVERVLF